MKKDISDTEKKIENLDIEADKEELEQMLNKLTGIEVDVYF